MILSEDQVRALVSAGDLVDTMERALIAFSCGEARQPLRTVLELASPADFFFHMPAVLADPPLAGAKLVTLCPDNAGLGLPTHQATIVVVDAHTGLLKAVLAGRYLTEARTAAVSAVSARALARSDADVLAILGSGVQARAHLEALPQVRAFREIRAWSPHSERLMRFVADSREKVTAASSAAEAVADAGVIVLATSSSTPVIARDWVKPGAHVISVGAPRPSMREMDPDLVASCRLFVDSRLSALAESGDIVRGIREGRFTEAHIVAELGEVLAGQVPGRRSDNEITVFKSLGLAVEDLAAAAEVLRRLSGSPNL
ncbi:MAG: ornithine cyclodeaminase family protein [Acidobacteria bacterium]|nr:ornithine cyclodeaminase family protein [Acidobacteriota bacterium]